MKVIRVKPTTNFWYPEGDTKIAYLLVPKTDDFHEIAVPNAKTDKDAKIKASIEDTGSKTHYKDYKIVARNKKQYEQYKRKYGW